MRKGHSYEDILDTPGVLVANSKFCYGNAGSYSPILSDVVRTRSHRHQLH